MDCDVFLNAYASSDGDAVRGAARGDYVVPERLANRLDPMTTLTLEMAHALRPFITADPERVGISLANRVAGWTFGEPEMVRLHDTRFAMHVNPFLGTAWFPAAPQGEVSIAHRFLGHSKTFTGAGAALVHAFAHAVRLIRSGAADQMVAGAFEWVSSPWLMRQLRTEPRQAAALFVLGRHPEPNANPHPVSVEVAGESGGEPAGGTYAVDAAIHLIDRLESSPPGRLGCIELADPLTDLSIAFRVRSQSGRGPTASHLPPSGRSEAHDR